MVDRFGKLVFGYFLYYAVKEVSGSIEYVIRTFVGQYDEPGYWPDYMNGEDFEEYLRF